MKKPSDEARRRYVDYIKDYKTAIDAFLLKEKKIKEEVARRRRGGKLQEAGAHG